MHLGKKSDETATHRWKLYVRGPRNEDLSSFILKVAFILHPSFPEPVRGKLCKSNLANDVSMIAKSRSS